MPYKKEWGSGRTLPEVTEDEENSALLLKLRLSGSELCCQVTKTAATVAPVKMGE